MEEIKNGRIVGIDIIKAMAVLFVICAHFSLNTNYYNTPIAGADMFVQSCLRWLFYAGVPLFLMCTGYLNYKKTINRSYYLKIFRVVIPYVLISILCLLLKKPAGDAPVGFQHAVFSIFNFTANSYSWYVNMYIGLFMLAPLLNVALTTLDRKKLCVLLVTLISVIALPVNVNPLFNNIHKISYLYFPDWWQGLYPLIYYFIGAYIAKYKIQVRKSICFAAVAIVILLQTGLQMLLNRYGFNNWAMSDYSSLFVIAESLALFLLLYSSNVKSLFLEKTVKCISMLTLEIYLFSNITDSYIYPYFISHFFGPANLMTQEKVFNYYFLLIVPLSFLSSLLMSLCFHKLYGFGEKGLKALIKRKNLLQQ
ncbi:MAG: acyltransferase family protein [Clostridiaceae bacterium]|nr:acyltransferase family protein [Clostridiaceae bacterium]